MYEQCDEKCTVDSKIEEASVVQGNISWRCINVLRFLYFPDKEIEWEDVILEICQKVGEIIQ